LFTVYIVPVFYESCARKLKIQSS